MQTPLKIAIVGSGLVGSLLAIYLKKEGHEVHVYIAFVAYDHSAQSNSYYLGSLQID